MTKANAAFSFPPPLKSGGTIGIVSPACWPKPEWITEGKAMLEKRGYQVVVHPQNYLKDGQLAGSDAARIEAIMDMFADTTIDAIICARGGKGALRIIDKLDYKLIRDNPKPFIGFSDITLLLQAINKRCGFVTYHGPMFWNFATDTDPRTLDNLFTVIGSKKETLNFHYAEVECLRPGSAEGKLVGGNITLLENLIGTAEDWTAKDGILFLEDVDEKVYKFDRALNHLKLAKKFDGVRAVLLGEMVDIEDEDPPYGRDLKQILLEHIPDNIPICMNFPCGHGKYLTTLPVGAQTKLTLNAHGAELSFTSS